MKTVDLDSVRLDAALESRTGDSDHWKLLISCEGRSMECGYATGAGWRGMPDGDPGSEEFRTGVFVFLAEYSHDFMQVGSVQDIEERFGFAREHAESVWNDMRRTTEDLKRVFGGEEGLEAFQRAAAPYLCGDEESPAP